MTSGHKIHAIVPERILFLLPSRFAVTEAKNQEKPAEQNTVCIIITVLNQLTNIDVDFITQQGMLMTFTVHDHSRLCFI